MISYSAQIFKDLILKLKVGTQNGRASVSKPLFIFSVLELINEGVLIENKLYHDNTSLRERYKVNALKYLGAINTQFGPFFTRPFYHLNSEPFYELVWKGETRLPTNSYTPSAKYLRENLEYAKLDEGLWELLQDPENRAYLKQAIFDRYLKN